MKKHILFFLLPVIIGLLSCAGDGKRSVDLPPGQIYQEYTIHYDEEGSGTVRAEFRSGASWDRMENEKTGGDAVILTGKSKVKCNGQVMNMDKDPFTGEHYTLPLQKGSDSVFIEYTDKDGKQYNYAIRMFKFSLVEEPGMGSRSEGMTIRWKGDPVQRGERVVVQLEGKENKKKRTISENITDPGASAVTFSYEQYRHLDGPVRVSAWRELYLKPVNATPEGTVIHLRGASNIFTKSTFFR